ncbi:type II CAAX endopeptidase family protein [Saccharibacillus sp. CPCC 101409]|uniref:CPBP family intramembrane glutamic endopeptidase n=1 Tax=Saccharibacillus sp. CPCC 101409 TaxID=3058041 RepID=UPI0026727A4C|nr:type II CAAX endopeptidase family protein [Saccharibacillus sp. CPCC 101409]MDO3411042.1 type II CAAX endopeptidase family protein [Saccharibacillus sp. CPCC 101409]
MTDPQQRILHVNYKKLGLAAALALVVYILFNFTTLFQSEMTEQTSGYSLITPEQAQSSAADFASSALAIEAALGEPQISYRSDSDLYGYLSKNDLIGEYDRTYVDRFPYEMFRVIYHYEEGGAERVLLVDVGGQTGKVTAFSDLPSDFAAQLSDGTVDPDALEDTGIAQTDKEAAAAPLLEELELDPAELEPTSSADSGGLSYTDSEVGIGDSDLNVSLTFEGDHVASIRPAFQIPQAYTAYIDEQTKWAEIMTYGGYMLLSFVLGVLAIVYAIRLRKYSSFKRGIFLAIFTYAVSVFSVWNSRPYFEGGSFSSIMFWVAFILQIGLGLVTSASLYFSFVGGDALWRSQGRNMWARRGERFYGRHVWAAARTGYLWAFILLAVQAVIFFVLERTLGVFSTTDDSQSTYNMMYAWLFPILAWMAGISEEAIYRLFGIPMLKKIVRSTLLASVITSIIWAFGHTLYSIYPVITRPIELLVLGLLFSFIFLRYGYITAMFAHVVFDSILMGLSLIFMGTPGYILIGIISIVLPGIVAFAIYLFNRKDKPLPPGGEFEEHPPAPRDPQSLLPGAPKVPGWSLAKDERPTSV